MAVREDTGRDVRHEPERHGRHGRPRPFGGRFRLPTLRFSGAAMAMSTVVGISIATTLLLNEQQGIGRRAGVARVGTTPPPTPGATDQAEAVSDQPSTATSGATGPSAARPPARRPSALPSARPSGAAPVAATPPGTRPTVPTGPVGGQAAAEPVTPSSGAHPAGTEAGAPAPAGPSPAAQPQTPAADQPVPGESPNAPGLKPPVSTRPGPPPAATVPGAGPAPTVPGGDPAAPGTADPGPADPGADQALSGVPLVAALGRDGLRHELGLTVTEPVTALQAEFRLAPGESAPGTGAAWTDLPGAAVTAQQERGILVYRFTTPPGTDVRPGHYTFGVRGTRPTDAPAVDPAAPRKAAPAESWSASAFAIQHPRAVAALGAFGPVPPLTATPRPTPSQPVPSQPASPLPTPSQPVPWQPVPGAPDVVPAPGLPAAPAAPAPR